MQDNGATFFETPIPHSAGRVNFNTTAKDNFSANEAFKTLRSNIFFCSNDIKTILITSVNENEGKTSVATELSKSLAEANKKTLLIDADMRKSVILRRNINSQSILGLSDFLSGQANIEDVLYNTQISTFDVIFSGRFPPNPVELLGTEKFKNMIKQLEKIYDYIIIDTPPLLPVIDASVISTCCGGAIFVISVGKTKYQDAITVKEQLLKSNCKILGAVLNDVNAKHKYSKASYDKNRYYTERK